MWSSAAVSASGFDVLCIQRWHFAYLGYNEWLFELLLPIYHLTGYFLFFGPFSVNPRDGCV